MVGRYEPFTDKLYVRNNTASDAVGSTLLSRSDGSPLEGKIQWWDYGLQNGPGRAVREHRRHDLGKSGLDFDTMAHASC